MAKQEHIHLLKQGAEIWNQWKKEHSDIQPDLVGVDLSRVDLRGADLSYVNLSKANLEEALLYETNCSGAFFHEANLSDAHLRQANFSGADLSQANLCGANFRRASLWGANFWGADFSEADFSETDLWSACLVSSNLWGTNLSGADLSDADLSGAVMVRAVLANIDLRGVKGLENMHHQGPSYIDIHTLVRSEGAISQAFLRGVGVSDSFITYARSLADKPMDFYSCFISYSSKDQGFAERLYADLQSKGVRCWYAPHHMKTGDKIRDRIDESIRIYDKLLLVLSEHSVTSTWVEHEVEAALDKERLAKERYTPQTVLFPITLDDAITVVESSWPAKVRRERHITDFRHWKQHDAYQQAFECLLLDLRVEQTPKG